ncbi:MULTISPECIES: hypothetical protein [unclassified Duganella]|uniref:hypothetical protein n=1 Tax=unclassified Duganella TaxID=2636909 RepID=UPI0006F2C57D|nr:MULTISPECIES: hypothetical protein [unclassified Duganella]KQV55390.1 hypothetical protein ASD07_28020 [Duganella sp. Root336D2]KRB95843.1 hypothetical protein ASE26_26160 [Duganella sp. Root198D2]
MNGRPLLIAAALLAAAPARAGDDMPVVQVVAAADAEWHSYRQAYKAASFFAPYVAKRPLIQAHLQIRPLAPEAPMEGLHIKLEGETTNLDIAVDMLGRATLPLLKQAFDEDAVLRLNRRKGYYQFSGRYSIRTRDDGVYPLSMLREACEQLISAQRASGYRLRLLGKECKGVKFIYAPGDANAAVQLRQADASRRIAAQPGLPFENRSMGSYQVVTVRLADWPAQAEAVPLPGLLGIGTVYE